MLPRNAVAVEICSVEGLIGAVIVPQADGRIVVYEPGDPEFERYVKVTNRKSAELVNMKDSQPD